MTEAVRRLEQAPSTDDLREQIAEAIKFVATTSLTGNQVDALAWAVEGVVAPLLAAKRDEVNDWTRRDAEIDDLLAASRARVAELTRERDTALELLDEVLGSFWEKGHPGEAAVRSEWVREDRFSGWWAKVKELRSGRPSTQEAPAPLDGRLTDADDYGQDYDAQAHALGLPEVGEAGEPPALSTRPRCTVCDMPLCEVSGADPCFGCCACVGSCLEGGDRG